MNQGIRFSVAFTCSVLVAAASGQTTWFVDLANCPGPGSGTQVDPFCVIQDGIDAAIDGDEVVVADGTYAGFRNTNLNFGGRLITVRSASGDPSLCTIHGGFANRGFIFNTGETNAAIVSGLTIDTGVGPDGGGAFQITSAGPTISNCIMVNSFTDSGAPGGSIYILNGNPVITGCRFTNSFSHSPGGAIYCDNASPTISDCVFTDSFSSADGGAIYCAAGSSPSITDCLFENSAAIDDGGAIYSSSDSSPNITACTFINNRTINGSGGAMFNFESDLQLAGCGFTGNSSPNGFGAAIFISRSSGSIIGCDFEGNSALFGGALRLRENSSPTLEDCTFVGNVATALNGGAIDSFGGSSPTITGCLFESNVAAQFGGAIVNHTQADAVISGCTFDRNHAATEGGAIFTFASSPSVSTTTFTGNTAGLQGGAVYNNAADLTLDDCAFHNNQAGVGTGECPAAGDGDMCSGPRVVNEGTFGGSTVGNTGTDVTSCTTGDTFDEWFCYTPTCSGTATASLCFNTNFDTSLAVFEECGGTELACSDDFCGLQSRVNWPVMAGTPYFVRVAGFGGATGEFELQISCSPDATIGDGGAMQSINASTVIATNSFFTGNTASDIGGAVSSEDSDISCANCTFRFNEARNGAGMIILNATDSSLTDCTFDNNTAENAGGGVFLVASSVTVTGCEFLHNAAGIGGGLEISNGNTVVTASRFVENTASFAAGMHNTNSDSIVTACTFLGNVAGVSGGGMDNFSSSPTVTDCIFLDNEAFGGFGGAGMINVSSSQPDIVNCVFSGNVAFKGAALSNGIASSPHVVNCSFSNNAADAGNGVIHSDTNSEPVIRNSIVWGNQGESFAGDGSANISNSIVQGGAAGVLVFDVNPLFIDADGPDDLPGTEDDDLRIRLGSPAIDFGDNAAVPVAVTTDLDGFDRFIDGDDDGFAAVDLGAYEFDGLTTVYVLNLTQDTTSGTIALAIQDAVDADDLLASPAAFGDEPEIDFKGKAISLRSDGAIDQISGGLFVLADGSLLESAPGAVISLAGELRVPSGDAADVIADELITAATGRIVVRPGAGLFVTTGSGATLDGETSLFSQSTLGVVGDATNGGTMTLLSHATLAVGGQFLNNGSLGSSFADLDIDLFRNAGSAVLLGITLFADQLVNDVDGTLIAYGEIIADVLNDGSATYTADTLVVGDYTNNGTTNVQGGTLTILGSLINNGTIVGDVASDSAFRGASDNGLSISGDYISGPTASILMPDPSWTVKVGGNFDVAIEDNQRYDMATAKLSISPSSSEVKTFELMSTDIGADPSGLDRSLPGHFPIGTLHIGPSASVQLVDFHDNDTLGQTSCEALYVRDLSLESGAVLITGSCKAYYVHFTGLGMVDDPANLRQIVILPGDGDGDGQVNLRDHRSFADCLTGPGGGLLPNCAVFDFDIDMDVDLDDFGSFNEALSDR